MGSLQKAALCGRLFPSAARTRLHCAPRTGLAVRAGALGTGAGRLPAMAAHPPGVSSCLRLAACCPPPMQAPPPPSFSSKAAQDSLPTSNRSGCAPLQAPLAVVTALFFFPRVGVMPTPAVRRWEGWGTYGACVGTCGISPGEEGAGPWSHPASVSSFMSWRGSRGWWVCPASRGATSLSSVLSFAKLLQGDARVKNNSFSPFPLKETAIGCPGSKPNALLCFHRAGGSKCCCCGENPGLASCCGGLRTNSIVKPSQDFFSGRSL